MKKVIRYNAFETNSSSMHTVTVRGKRNIDDYYKSSIERNIDKDGNIVTTLDEYGWYGEPLTNFWEKLPYALLMVLYTEYSGFDYYDNNFTIDQDKLEKCTGYQNILEAIQSCCKECKGIIIEKMSGYYPYGYIDHQSYEDYKSLNDFLNDWNVDIEHFLFDDNIKVYIGNDNG